MGLKTGLQGFSFNRVAGTWAKALFGRVADAAASGDTVVSVRDASQGWTWNMTSLRNAARLWMLPLLGVTLLALTGCEFLAFTDEGLVKHKIEQHAAAISAKDWRAAAAFHDAKFTWAQGRRKMSGRAATQAFLKSISEIQSNDSFYTDVDAIKTVKEGQMIEALVSFQAHIVENSMAMRYSNMTWQARMYWVKRGNADWRLLGLQEITERAKRPFSRAGT